MLAVGRFFELCLFTFFLSLKVVEKRKWSISFNRLFCKMGRKEGYGVKGLGSGYKFGWGRSGADLSRFER